MKYGDRRGPVGLADTLGAPSCIYHTNCEKAQHFICGLQSHEIKGPYSPRSRMHRPSVEEISDKPPVRCVAAFSYIGNAAVQRDTLIQFAGSLAELRHDEESIRSDRIIDAHLVTNMEHFSRPPSNRPCETATPCANPSMTQGNKCEPRKSIN